MKLIKAHGMLAGRDGKVYKVIETPLTDHMPHYWEVARVDGQPLVTDDGKPVMERRPYVYNDATVQSMLTPAAYSAGTYPYGWCVTDSGNTYQVNNYSGTSEGLAHADWDDLGAGVSFTPVSTPADVDAVRANQTDRTFGTGTKWAGEYTTAGLEGHYIQVADIDLKFDTQHPDGAFYNGGAGWLGLNSGYTPFSGKYDSGGLCIDNMGINRTNTNWIGLFGYVNNAILKNINLSNVNIISIDNQFQGVLSGYYRNTIIDNCFISGLVFVSGSDRFGGFIGIDVGASSSGLITNSLSAVVIASTASEIGGFGGRVTSEAGNEIKNVLSLSYVTSSSHRHPLVARVLNNGYTFTDNYHNNDIFPHSGSDQSTPKTTAELLAGTPSEGIYTDWDTRIWRFVAGRYPVHRFFGELPVNIPAPHNIQTSVVGSDIVLTWDDYPNAPKPLGYFIYQSTNNGAWQKLNATAITDKTYTVVSPAIGSHNFFVTAQYFRRYLGETGNSPTTLQAIV